ncbi:FAD-dependent monooxygenase [Kribbella shirazensis]|uniref:2-polyprenyl-6-methoxyphenol hydroxylase-like FAD-dependent oxidoreductase n=1 Tax=Kribbella shirazensis TaxID=1105143 RepID=A0A7X5ZY10_9ACTN|nr:FAD-dependent monooxygenase [Kribbella shirazensis]NIK54467.1 2-polyprenyl-6-methoxyphenol hydroxylase-like FAD-dependent oxidoreductase [Kribbella shirazensis]
MDNAIVIGGGIAGLAAAASLVRSGWDVRVLEAAPELGEIGAGLVVTVNGERAAELIGAAERIRRSGYGVRAAGTRRWDGKWLLKAPDGAGTRMIGIHRRGLHQALVEGQQAELVTGARVVAVEPGVAGGERARVTWESADGTHSARADLVVAADGIRSVARSALFSTGLRYSGFSCWRAATPDTTLDDRFAMTWGPSAEFGALRISADEVYWYGYVAMPSGRLVADERRAVREYFATWAPDVRALIESTGEVIRHDVWVLDRPLPRYTIGRTVLIGDAAHPMLPTLGQGANSALEDAVTLGLVIPAAGDLAAGLRAYESQRYRRTRRIVSRSAQQARVGAHLGARGQTLRNALLRITPPAAALRNGTRIFEWTPPGSFGAQAVDRG